MFADAKQYSIPYGDMINSALTLVSAGPESISYAARAALELGADIVKVNYTGDAQCFGKVVAAAGRCKVISAGGSKQSDAEFCAKVKEVLAAGGVGMAVGRNVWQHDTPMKITEEIKKIVYK